MTPPRPLDGADRTLSMQERIGQATMALLDHLAAEYPDVPLELETVAVVVAVHAPEGATLDGEIVESENGSSFIEFYVEDPRRWVQAGLLDEAWRRTR